MRALEDWFRGLPFRSKLVVLILSTSVVALVLEGGGFAAYARWRAQAEMERDIQSLARIVAARSVTALKFNDVTVANEALATLQDRSIVVGAAIYDARGRRFALYSTAVGPDTALAPVLPSPVPEFDHAHLQVEQAILEGSQRVGTVVVRASLADLDRVWQGFLLYSLLVVLLTGSVAFWMASRLQRLLSLPLQRLIGTVQAIASQPDYSARASFGRDKEFEALVGAFNAMLENIERSNLALLQANAQLLEHRSQLQQSNDRLEERVADRTQALAQSNERLNQLADEAALARRAAESANAAKGQLLANMSHEFRTPMNAIIGMCYLGLRAQPDASQRRYLHHIEVAAHNLRQLVNEVLDLSKIDAGRLTLEIRPFALNDLIDGLVKIQAQRAFEKGLEFNVLVGANVPPMLSGDLLRLGQVCQNLLSNAIKFTDSGEVLVTIDRVGEDERGVRLRIEVTDSGVGIADEAQSRIFLAFEQADESTTRRYGGTGLGLNICQRLVHAMGGDIGVRSQEGRGSTFWVELTLPAANGDGAPALGGWPARMAVMVVGGHPSAGRAMRSLLAPLATTIELVDSGEAALLRLTTAAARDTTHVQAWDLILLDRQLPGLSALDTAARLRAALPPGPTRIVLMTSAFDDESGFEALGRRMIDGVLIRPATASSLHDALVSAFGQTAAGADPPALVQDAPGHRLGGLRVLVAEDNAVNCEVLDALLELLAIKASFVDNGEAALQTLSEHEFDLVLMDVEMPRMGGLEATRRIRADERLADLPIIVMTAHDATAHWAHYLEAGIDDCLEKPVAQAALQSILSRWDLRDQGAATAPLFPGVRALIIEDVATNRELLRELLENVGIAVTEAEDGPSGLAQLGRQAFDVVLLDIQMPAMDGHEVAQRLRADPRTRALPLIAVTARHQPDDRAECLAAGMNGHVTKPIDPKRLYRQLARALNRRSE